MKRENLTTSLVSTIFKVIKNFADRTLLIHAKDTADNNYYLFYLTLYKNLIKLRAKTEVNFTINVSIYLIGLHIFSNRETVR